MEPETENDERVPTARKASKVHQIFMGKEGLRAGWSVLIFLFLAACVSYTLNTVIHKLRPGKVDLLDYPVNLISEAGGFAVVFACTWLMSKIERRPNWVYGLGGLQPLRRFLTGLAWGVVSLSLLVGILWKLGLLVIDQRLLAGGDIFQWGLLWFVDFLFVGLMEEYLTRGFLQFTLTRGFAGFYRWAFKSTHSTALGFWSAALLLSILFGMGHSKNPGESPFGLMAAALFAMVFCLSLWRTGSLWWAIGFHAAWDWCESFLYGVGDSGLFIKHRLLGTHPVGQPLFSGGTTGPEGSIYLTVIFVLVVAVILFTLPRPSVDLQTS